MVPSERKKLRHLVGLLLGELSVVHELTGMPMPQVLLLPAPAGTDVVEREEWMLTPPVVIGGNTGLSESGLSESVEWLLVTLRTAIPSQRFLRRHGPTSAGYAGMQLLHTQIVLDTAADELRIRVSDPAFVGLWRDWQWLALEVAIRASGGEGKRTVSPPARRAQRSQRRVRQV